MISRSLGPEFGASIGLILAMANAVSCGMNCVGFCESLLDVMKRFDLKIVDGAMVDMRILGSITIVLLLALVVVGLEWEAKVRILCTTVFIIILAQKKSLQFNLFVFSVMFE